MECHHDCACVCHENQTKLLKSCICQRKPIEYYLAMSDQSPFYEEKREIRQEDGTLTTVLTMIKIRPGVKITEDMVPYGYTINSLYPDMLLRDDEYVKEDSPYSLMVKDGLNGLLMRITQKQKDIENGFSIDNDILMMSFSELRQEAIRIYSSFHLPIDSNISMMSMYELRREVVVLRRKLASKPSDQGTYKKCSKCGHEEMIS